MIKELTPLEALKEIRDKIGDKMLFCAWNDKGDSYSKKITISDYCDIIEKPLKALEIIKEKKVDIQLLFDLFEDNRNDYRDYNESNECRWLKKKEYDLLKEVLL